MRRILTAGPFIYYLGNVHFEYETQDAQFKFLHRRIATDVFLFKIQAADTDLCCFCQGTQETLIHFFWDCPVTRAFWNSAKDFLGSVDLMAASEF